MSRTGDAATPQPVEAARDLRVAAQAPHRKLRSRAWVLCELVPRVIEFLASHAAQMLPDCPGLVDRQFHSYGVREIARGRGYCDDVFAARRPPAGGDATKAPPPPHAA